MKIKLLVPTHHNGKLLKLDEVIELNDAEASSLIDMGAAAVHDKATETSQTLPPFSAEDLAGALFDRHSEFKEEDFRKDSRLPKADAVRRVLERDDVGGELLEQALGLLEDKLKEE